MEKKLRPKRDKDYYRASRIPSESEWTRKICKDMEKIGAIVVPIVGSSLQMSGIPDRCVFHKKLSRGVWLEFKGRDTLLRLNQKLWMAKLNKIISNSAFVVRYPGYFEYCYLNSNNKVSTITLNFEYNFNDGEDLIRSLERLF